MARLIPTALAPTLPTVDVAASRALSAADHGLELRCARGITLSVPSDLPSSFVCRVSAVAAASAARALVLGNRALVLGSRALVLG